MSARYLIYNERYPDGTVVSRLEYLRENLRCRRTKEHMTAILVDESVWKAVDNELNVVSNETTENKGA